MKGNVIFIIVASLETVKKAVNWGNTRPKPDLGLFNIPIADGDSLEILIRL